MADRVDSAALLMRASPEAIFDAFVDPDKLIAWLPPDAMSGRVLEFDPVRGGRYRIELIYDEAAGGTGKSGERSDISAGTFLAIEPGRRIVQSVVFESDDPAFAGEMIVTWHLDAVGDDSRVTVTAEHVPPGIPREDHQAGLASSLENLARFVERG